MNNEKLNDEKLKDLARDLGIVSTQLQLIVNRLANVREPTIPQIYGLDPTEYNPPEGWEWVIEDYKPAFRVPKVGESFLGVDRNVWTSGGSILDPLLIVRKKAKPQPKLLKICQTFIDTGDFREARKGEWFRNSEGVFLEWPVDGPSEGKYHIYRLVREPNECLS